MKNIDDILKKVELAEEKARLANLKYQNLEKNIEIQNNKLLELERIFGLKITDGNKNKRLNDIGFDSVKVVEISTSIENILNIKFNLTSLFTLKLDEFKKLTKPNTTEYEEVIAKIDKIKNNTEVNSKQMDINDNVGYCSFMLFNNIITDDEFKKIKNYQTRVSKGELGCQAIDDLNRFVDMSRECVKKLDDEGNLNYFKKELTIFKSNFNDNLENIHTSWCQFNSKIIIYLDENLEEIPKDINDINVVFKYLN